MSYAYVVLGAGRQGVAVAYDLARHGEARQVVLADVDAAAARQAVARLEALLPEARCRFVARPCDVGKPAEVALVVSGADVVISAVPYRFNADLTDQALAAGASFCDLGGNTAVVRQQLARHEEALRRGVSVAPDCGLAPGLGNILAAHAVRSLDEPRDVHVRCGGLPERPVGPLGYKLTFSVEGLLNEYTGFGEFLRDGRPVRVPALTEMEEIEFPAPVGRCEAAVTSGGTSTCAETFAGRLRTYDYKTVRYPGHFAVVRALLALGCFEEQLALSDGSTLAPRRVFGRLLEERLRYPDVGDIVVLRCTVRGRHGGRERTVRYELFDRQDPHTGFSAMERTTAFPAALVAYMQARRAIAPGARPLECCVPTGQYLQELPAHGISLTVCEE